MPSRSLFPSLLAASGAFACAASTKCIPDVFARQFTIVRGDVDAMLVQEYSLSNGCSQVTIDSIVRRGIEPGSPGMIKTYWGGEATAPSAAVTVYGRWALPKLDSATAAACSNIHAERHVDSIPRSRIFRPGAADWPIEEITPVDPDSVYACLNGSCARIAPRVVDNAPTGAECIVGVSQPFATDEEAASFLRARIATSPLRPRILDRIQTFYEDAVPLLYCIPFTTIDTFQLVATPAARATSTGDTLARPQPIFLPIRGQSAPAVETRFTLDPSYVPGLAPLRSWDDPSIPPELALPSSANAGDFFAPETILFRSSGLDGRTDGATLRYATGASLYEYRGGTRTIFACGDPGIQFLPTRVGDSLRLVGLDLGLSNRARCPGEAQDIHAAKHARWLYLPTDDAPFQDDFRHTSEAENSRSWPIENDSVLVRGRKVALAALQSFVSTLPRERRAASFSARVVDGAVAVTLAKASTVRIASPDGRILSSSVQPSGTSRVELPRGHRGILLLDADGGSLRVLAP